MSQADSFWRAHAAREVFFRFAPQIYRVTDGKNSFLQAAEISMRAACTPQIGAQKILCDLGFSLYIRVLRIRCVRGHALSGFFCRPKRDVWAALCLRKNANDQSADSERTTQGVGEIEVTGADELS